MTTCRGCGSEVSQTRTTFNAKAEVVKEECPMCAPNSFDPKWLRERGAMAWEAYPDKYVKIYLPDGRTGYRATDEWRQDSEDKIRQSYARADQMNAAALDEKRRTRRTAPMTEEEIRKVTARWRPILEDRQEQKNRAWNEAVSDLTQ